MNIIIAGAGAVGYHLAKMLASDEQNIYLIDTNPERLQYVQSHIDVITTEGDCKLVSVMEAAKVKECDLFLAVTHSEEINLLSSIIAKRNGATRTIARVNNLEMLQEEIQNTYQSLGVDTIISPVKLAAEEILRLVSQSAFTDDFEFEGGKLSVFGITVGSDSLLIDKTVVESAELNPNLVFKAIALNRNEETIVIKSSTKIQKGDIIYFTGVPESINKVIEICGQKVFPIRNVMILGGTRLAILTAGLLEKTCSVVLVEKDKEKCNTIARKLKKTLVINHDGRDVGALEEEGLETMDAFIALTGDSETNIISSMVAKNHGVKKTIARVENIDYIHLSQNIGIDTLINQKMIAASNIFKYVRKGEVDAIASLNWVDAEIIEFNVKNGSKITKQQLRDIRFPQTASIAGVIREGKGFIPFGSFQLQDGDKAIVFSKTECIHEVETYFQ